MADNDLSKYSTEELQAMLGKMESSSSEPQGQENPELLKSLGQGYLNYAKGALRGMGQAAGDFGASAINWPISGIEKLTGAHIPHVPHPSLLNEHPGSLGESIGQNVGQFGAMLGLPGGVGVKAAQLANKGYQTLRAGQKLPLIGKLLAGGAGGALEGAAGNEENRPLGAKIGAVLGAGGQGAASALGFAKGIRSKNIANQVKNEFERLGQHFNERFTGHLAAGEEAGANKFMRPEKANMKLLKKSGEGKLAYGLEKFNENPTLSNAHQAQSDLNKIVKKYSRSKEGTLESDVHSEALKLKNRLLKKISEGFEKAGAKEHGEGYQQSRVDYANEMAPYLDSPTINALLGRNKRGVPTIRPKEFADKLLQEEEFLAQSGQKHPELLQREKYNKLKSNKLAQGAALGAGGLSTAFLPYEIRKLLGAH
jgi:hypothetical protein